MTSSILIHCCHCGDIPSESISSSSISGSGSGSDSGSVSQSTESVSEVSVISECSQCVDNIRAKNWRLTFSGGGTSPCASDYNGSFDLFNTPNEATRSNELALFTAPSGDPSVCTTLSSYFGGSIKRFTLTCITVNLGSASYWSLSVLNGFQSNFFGQQSTVAYTNLQGGDTGYLNEIDCLSPITLYRDPGAATTVNEIDMPATCVISPI